MCFLRSYFGSHPTKALEKCQHQAPVIGCLEDLGTSKPWEPSPMCPGRRKRRRNASDPSGLSHLGASGEGATRLNLQVMQPGVVGVPHGCLNHLTPQIPSASISFHIAFDGGKYLGSSSFMFKSLDLKELIRGSKKRFEMLATMGPPHRRYEDISRFC